MEMVWEGIRPVTPGKLSKPVQAAACFGHRDRELCDRGDFRRTAGFRSGPKAGGSAFDAPPHQPSPGGSTGGCLQRSRYGRDPPGSAGVSPALVSAQPGPFPRRRSTGKHARPLLRPGPRRSRRQAGPLPHRRYTEAVDAGGTPALPGGLHLLDSLAGRVSFRPFSAPSSAPSGWTSGHR